MASILKVDQIQTAAGGTPTAADLGITGTGKILQVVATQGLNSDFTTGSNADVSIPDTSISITPTSTSSRIFVTWYGITPHAFADAVTDVYAYAAYRGTTKLADIGAKRGFANATSYIDQTTALSVIDHPNTTSTVSYSLYGRIHTGDNTAFLHRALLGSEPRVRMVAMEIDMSTEWSS